MPLSTRQGPRKETRGHGAPRAAEPDLEAAIARGDFEPLRAWLGVHVHAHGSTRGLFERVREATGADLSVGPLVRSLAARYGAGG